MSDPILKISSKAQVQSGVTMLEFQADLSSFVTGNYVLAVRGPQSMMVRRIHSVVISHIVWNHRDDERTGLSN